MAVSQIDAVTPTVIYQTKAAMLNVREHNGQNQGDVCMCLLQPLSLFMVVVYLYLN